MSNSLVFQVGPVKVAQREYMLEFETNSRITAVISEVAAYDSKGRSDCANGVYSLIIPNNGEKKFQKICIRYDPNKLCDIAKVTFTIRILNSPVRKSCTALRDTPTSIDFG